MKMRPIDADTLLEGLDKNCGDLDLQYNSEYDELVHYIDSQPTLDFEPVMHEEWIGGHCSACGAEAPYNDIDEAIFDYDWEENLRYSHTETRREYHEKPFCHNCGAKMDGGK
jgi:hypothetical protein